MSTYVLQHGSSVRDLLGDLVIEDGLNQDEKGAVLGLNTELLCLQVNSDIFDVADTALGLGLAGDPITELVVGGIAATFTILIFIITKDELLLEIIGKLLLTGSDSLGGHIDSPLIILDLSRFIELESTVIDTASQFIIAAGFNINVSVLVGSILGVVLASAIMSILIAVGIAILLSLASSLLVSLVLLVRLWLILKDETTELEAEVDIGSLTTSLAIKYNMAILDNHVGLGVLALLAENKLIDEAIKVILKLGCLVGTIDDPSIVGRIRVGLGTKFETKVLDYVGSRACQRLSNAAEIDNDGLNTVSFAFDLRLELLHLVAVEGIFHIASDIDGSHDCDLLGVPLASLCVLFRVELGPLDDRTMRHMTCRECGGRGSERAQKEILGCILLTRHSTRRVCISRCY